MPGKIRLADFLVSTSESYCSGGCVSRGTKKLGRANVGFVVTFTARSIRSTLSEHMEGPTKQSFSGNKGGQKDVDLSKYLIQTQRS